MILNKDFVTTELVFQHRLLGYDSGYSFDLLCKEAEAIIQYLKSNNYWYEKDKLTGGVELTKEHCAHIISDILKRPILDWDNFEIIIGFFDASNFISIEQDVFALVAYFNKSLEYAFTTFLTKYIVDNLNLVSFDNKYLLDNDSFDELMKVNKEMNGRPLNFDKSKYVFFLERVDINDFIIGIEHQRGI